MNDRILTAPYVVTMIAHHPAATVEHLPHRPLMPGLINAQYHSNDGATGEQSTWQWTEQ